MDAFVPLLWSNVALLVNIDYLLWSNLEKYCLTKQVLYGKSNNSKILEKTSVTRELCLYSFRGLKT